MFWSMLQVPIVISSGHIIIKSCDELLQVAIHSFKWVKIIKANEAMVQYMQLDPR